jgi:hypothetical protein
MKREPAKPAPIRGSLIDHSNVSTILPVLSTITY